MTLFLAAVFAILAAVILLPPSRRTRMRKQLARQVAHLDVRAGRPSSRAGAGGLIRSILAATERSLGQRGFWTRTEGLLQGADLQLSAASFIWLTLGSGFVLGFLVAIANAPAAVGVIVGLLGTLVPYLFVRIRMQRRRRQFDQQLPDVLDSIAAVLKAGHSFSHALKSIADDYDPPVSTEFRRALAQVGVGLPIEEALDEMVARVESPDLKYVTTCVAVQRQAGGSLSEFFSLVATSVRERQEYARRVKSLTAQGRLTAKVIFCVPFAVILLLGSAHWAYMETLFTTGAGHVIIGLCVVLMTLGFFVIKRITRLEV